MKKQFLKPNFWILSILPVLLFQNCSSFDSDLIDENSKAEVLKASAVFAPSVKAVEGDISVAGNIKSHPVENSIPVSGSIGSSPAGGSIPASGSIGSSPAGGSIPASGSDRDPANADVPVSDPVAASPAAIPALAVDVKVPVTYFCSNNQTTAKGNFGISTGEVYAIYGEMTDSKNALLKCIFVAPDIKSQILSGDKAFSMNTVFAEMNHAGCPALSDGSYTMYGFMGSKISSNFNIDTPQDLQSSLASPPTQLALVTLPFSMNGSVPKSANSNSSSFSAAQALIDYNYTAHVTSAKCDTSASPLVIHLNSDVEAAQPLILTSQANGINFDILGQNAEPIAHSPKRISWHRSQEYFFIALPNAKGEVSGIDQLFGDNTFGPDGRFSHDGYQALAKFDGRSADGKKQVFGADGLITRQDPVFEKLRLWQDRNFDGVAQKSELFTLDQMKIQTIDLRFDGGYQETDIYGNQTKYKSVVKTKDGQYHLLFDIWFSYR